MSGGPLSAIQLNLRRELAALAEQEEEENTARSLLALMQKKKKKKSGIWPLTCLPRVDFVLLYFCSEETLFFCCLITENIKEEKMCFLVFVDCHSLSGRTNL